MTFSNITTILTSDVATGGTIVFNYPSGKNKGNFVAYCAVVSFDNNNQFETVKGEIEIALGDSAATVTNKSVTTIANGTRVTLQLNEPGPRAFLTNDGSGEVLKNANLIFARQINYGNVIAPDVDSAAVSQAGTASTALTLNGTLVTGGVATFDKARAYTITSAGNDSGITFTVTGTDDYENVLVETTTGANAGTAAGAKAFKTITSVVPSGNTAANVEVGHGDVLGFPLFILNATDVTAELVDGATAVAGTIVAGDQTTPTALTGDVRGTYDPNSAANGTLSFALRVEVSDIKIGIDQFAG